MAFLSKVGSLLKQTIGKQVNSELSASNPSIFQAIRCMSSSKLFVGGISYSTDDQSLREAFAAYGEVIEARVIVDRETGRSRGFGFVTYTSSEEASSAIQALDGQDLHGRRVKVNYATDRSGGFRSGGGYGGGGYGGGGYGGGGYGGGGSGGGGYGGGGYGGGGYGGGGSGGYGGGGYGGDNFSSGGSSGGYGGSGGVSSSGNYGVAGGSGGGDYVGSGAGGENSFASGGGYGGSAGTSYDGGDQYNGTQTQGGMGAGYGQDDENFRDDDDEPADYANKKEA
ncbi:PREDICTED: glycine-rich RNA-binding protein 3, mitochondrial [Nelumbo nucifera]|uniref:Glycine-rich RNA-binding protein 3, mitochondrial n=1 Tax=Nelumbo nucifera TaxID=4432 RepID=A0A1U7ZZI1_NELNU|nr:PREDICTED: glycine-rich RNA-binding protein 3, mitochondrial [Nelumbo nucifera]